MIVGKKNPPLLSTFALTHADPDSQLPTPKVSRGVINISILQMHKQRLCKMDHSPRSVKDGVGLEPVSLTPTWSCCLSLPLPPMYLHLLFFNRGDVRSGESVKQDKLRDPLRKLKEKKQE